MHAAAEHPDRVGGVGTSLGRAVQQGTDDALVPLDLGGRTVGVVSEGVRHCLDDLDVAGRSVLLLLGGNAVGAVLADEALDVR